MTFTTRRTRTLTLVAAALAWIAATVTAAACTSKPADDTAAPLVCTDLLAGDETTEVVVRFVNQTNADLYLGDNAPCDTSPSFRIYDAANHEVVYRYGNACGLSCADNATTCTCTMTTTCYPSYLRRIAPGGAYELYWSGARIVERTVPGSCVSCLGGQDPASCEAPEAPGDGPLTFTGTAWTAFDCMAPPCDCTPGPEGSCTTTGQGTITGTQLVGTGTFTPGSGTVDVVFQ
ncbi:MAG: hypothetical protein IT373_25190 [Polyangiaceae bacterium]|nr:hypothetical protein [Polyangiaceae bacterium]